MKKLKTKISSSPLLQNSFKGIPTCGSNTFPSFCRILFCFFTFIFFLFTLPACNTTEPDDNGKSNLPDTTTQNFTFETYEFGDGFSSSYFNDVWIFDENNIWAVGEVGSNEGLTNIMRWNGEKWYAQKPWFTSSGFQGMWALDSSNIYFANGAIIKYESGKFIETDLGNLGFTNGQGVHKLWGSSVNNIYGVGPNGTIVYFDGNAWTKIEFGTQWRFDDITGDKETGIAYAVALGNNFATAIVELNNLSANIIYNSEDLTSYTIELLNSTELLLSNFKIWKYDLKNKEAEILYNPGTGYFLPLSAKAAVNDLFFFGNKLSSGEKMIHYNGLRFKIFAMPERGDVIYGGSYAINNLAIMTGFSHNKAYLIKAERR